MTRVVIVRNTPVNRNRPFIWGGLSVLMAVVAGINLGIGVNMDCYHSYDSYYNCDYKKRAYIISGSCSVVSSACFLFTAVSLHIRIKKAMRTSASAPQQPVNIPPENPVQPVVTYPAMQTAYPPQYTQYAGPTPYSLSPDFNQYPPQSGFAVNQFTQPPYPQNVTKPEPQTQYPPGVSQPPPYAP